MNPLVWCVRTHDWISNDTSKIIKMIQTEIDLKSLNECLNHIPDDFKEIRGVIIRRLTELNERI